MEYIQENFEVGAADYIAVHDGARPIVSTSLITKAFQGAYKYQAIVLAQKVSNPYDLVIIHQIMLPTEIRFG
ncbi:hypothetical protein [Sphingobacterium sp. E70]|uniref:hypothetical protein n=1 Tax=Sphingobacterium sp. E70 TaxID=2853439 RepID=UPI00359C3E21